MNQKQCRFCSAALRHTFVDLGMSPLANSYITPQQLNAPEPFYPLHAYVCEHCFLVQLEEFATPSHIFSDYAYFSSYSDTWLHHAKTYTDMIVARLGLHSHSQVVEVGSNDGYLLQFFVARGISVLGIDPAANVAPAAREKGVPTVVKFFGESTARDLVAQGYRADLLIGNNVLAQVPTLNDFVTGIKVFLHPQGVVTMEFPHLMHLIAEHQFDTIYHEHFSYFSLGTVTKIFTEHGMTIFDVEELSTHGGSIRIYARHTEDVSKPVGQRIAMLLAREEAAGLTQLAAYLAFADKVKQTKRNLLAFLIAAKDTGKSIVGYGAPAKGNTLLNYCGIRSDFLDYTVDRNPYKQGHFLPGTHIPILVPDTIRDTRPDYLLILPWNLREEITGQMAYIREWGGQFVVPIPDARVYA
jgi:hypothetical protein